MNKLLCVFGNVLYRWEFYGFLRRHQLPKRYEQFVIEKKINRIYFASSQLWYCEIISDKNIPEGKNLKRSNITSHRVFSVLQFARFYFLHNSIPSTILLGGAHTESAKLFRAAPTFCSKQFATNSTLTKHHRTRKNKYVSKWHVHISFRQ